MMIIMNLSFYLMIFLFSLIVFIFNRKHLLTILISLELNVLILFSFLFFYLNFMSYEYFFSMIFLTFGVCESVLGLSLLVSLIRLHGNDNFQTFNIFQC